MSIKINSTEIGTGFKGTIGLGFAERLFVSSTDGETYSIYGTVFREETGSTVAVPSRSKVFQAGETAETYLRQTLHKRLETAKEINRLENLRESVISGAYDYGVSQHLVDTLKYLSQNTVRPTPVCLIGGNLPYEDLPKVNEESQPFGEGWEQWSFTSMGFKRYHDVEVINSMYYTPTADLLPEANPVVISELSSGSIQGPLIITPYRGSNGCAVLSCTDYRAEWAFDVFRGTEIKAVNADVFSVTVDTEPEDVLIIVGRGVQGIHVATVRLSYLTKGLSVSQEAGITAVCEFYAPYQSGRILSSVTSVTVSLTSLSEVLIGLFYGTAADQFVSDEVAGVDGNTIGFSEAYAFTIGGFTVPEEGYQEFAGDEVVVGSFNVPVRYNTPAGHAVYNAHVIQTTRGLYLTENVFEDDVLCKSSGTIYQLHDRMPDYTDQYFGDNTETVRVFDIPPGITSAQAVIKPGLVSVGTADELNRADILADAIDPSSGAPTLHILRIPVGLGLLAAGSAEIGDEVSAAAFVQVLSANKPSPLSDYDPSTLCGADASRLWISAGRTVQEASYSGSSISFDQNHEFVYNNELSTGFCVASNGGVARIVRDGVYYYPSLEDAVLYEASDEIQGLSGFTNVQNFMQSYPDPVALGIDHPVLDGTILDDTVDTPVNTVFSQPAYTGSYSSDLLDTALFSTGDSVVVYRPGDNSASPTQTISLRGSIVDGCSADVNGNRMIFLYLTADEITIKAYDAAGEEDTAYETVNSIVSLCEDRFGKLYVSQTLQLSFDLQPGIGVMEESGTSYLYAAEAGALKRAEVSRQGVVLAGSSTFSTLYTSGGSVITSIDVYKRNDGSNTVAIVEGTGLSVYRVIQGGFLSIVRELSGLGAAGFRVFSFYSNGEYTLVLNGTSMDLYSAVTLGYLVSVKSVAITGGLNNVFVLPRCVAWISNEESAEDEDAVLMHVYGLNPSLSFSGSIPFHPDAYQTIAGTREFVIAPEEFKNPAEFTVWVTSVSDIPTDPVTVTVTGGTVEGESSGEFTPGMVVSVSAVTPEGHVFIGWSGATGTMYDDTQETTYLTVPINDIGIVALYDSVYTGIAEVMSSEEEEVEYF